MTVPVELVERAAVLAAFVKTDEHLYNGRFIRVGEWTWVFVKDAILHSDLPPPRVIDETRKGIARGERGGWSTRSARISGVLWWCEHQWNPSGDVVMVVTGDEIGEPNEANTLSADGARPVQPSSRSTPQQRVHHECAARTDQDNKDWSAADILHADAEGKVTARNR